jgi:hypothetical protein
MISPCDPKGHRRERDEGGALHRGPWRPGHAPGRCAVVCRLPVERSSWGRPAGGPWGLRRSGHHPALGRPGPPAACRGMPAVPAAGVGERASGGDGQQEQRRVVRPLSCRGEAGPAHRLPRDGATGCASGQTVAGPGHPSPRRASAAHQRRQGRQGSGPQERHRGARHRDRHPHDHVAQA